MNKKIPKSVREVFETYPDAVKPGLLSLRELIISTHKNLSDVGELEETLKWGQPSYLTRSPQTGTTLRLGGVNNNPNQYALYVHCQTSLIETYKQMYPQCFSFSGKRALIFDADEVLPVKQLSHCIALALTYHANKS